MLPALAEGGSSSGFEFRGTTTAISKLYYSTSSTSSGSRADYYLIPGLKIAGRHGRLAVSVPDYFDAEIEPKNVGLYRMARRHLEKTTCLEVIPATVETSGDGTAMRSLAPRPRWQDRGLHLEIYNPDAGMYQFNAPGQALVPCRSRAISAAGWSRWPRRVVGSASRTYPSAKRRTHRARFPHLA